MKIYIARGDDTLGPYIPVEAAALIKGGYLFPQDLAARNNDADWVHLSSILPPEATVAPVSDVRSRLVDRPMPWPGFMASLGLLILLLAVGFALSTSGKAEGQQGRPPVNSPADAQQLATLNSSKPGPAVSDSLPPEEKGSSLTGTMILAGADGVPLKITPSRVGAYALKDLEPYLAQKQAGTQAELARLATEIEAAETERTARIAAEQMALEAFREGAASDELRPSLRFDLQQAKTAVQTAEDNCHYVLDQIKAATSADFYFDDLPAPAAVAQTDAAGVFTLKLPAGGPFAIAGCAATTKTETPRRHHWLVKAPSQAAGQERLSLSAANAVSSGSAESLIRAAE